MSIDVRRLFADRALEGRNTALPALPAGSDRLGDARRRGAAEQRGFDRRYAAIDLAARRDAGTGGALVSAGDTIGAGARALAVLDARLTAARADRRARSRAASSRALFLREADAVLEAARRSAGPGGEGLAVRVGTALEQAITRRLEALDEPGLSGALRRDLGLIAERVQVAAEREEARREQTYLSEALDGRAGILLARAARVRGEAQDQLVRAMTDDFRDAAAEGVLTPAAAERRIAAFRRTVAEAGLADDIARDPVAAGRRLDRGDYDALLSDDAARARLRQAIAAARERADAETRALLAQERRADLAALGERGEGVPGLRERLRRHAGTGALAEHDAEQAQARALYESRQALRLATPEAVARHVRAREIAGGDAAAAARVALAERELALATDPAGYVVRHQGAAPVTLRLARQRALGVATPRLYPMAEAAGTVARLRALSPAERSAALEDLVREAGDHRDRATRELGEAGLPASAALALARAGAADPDDLMRALFEAEAAGGADGLIRDETRRAALRRAVSGGLAARRERLPAALAGFAAGALGDALAAFAARATADGQDPEAAAGFALRLLIDPLLRPGEATPTRVALANTAPARTALSDEESP